MVRILNPPKVSGIKPEELSDHTVTEMARRFNRMHYHWHDVYYHTEDKDQALSVWSVMKFIREQTETDLEICGMHYSLSLTEHMQEMLFAIDHEAYPAITARLRGDTTRFRNRTLIEESMESSRMEGASTTRMKAKEMLRLKRKPRDEGERMIMNNYNMMESLRGMLDSDLSPEMVCEMHRIITSGTMKEGPEWEGRFREWDVVVADPLHPDRVSHVPPGFREVPGLVEGVCEFANSEGGAYLHPVVKAIILHFILAHVHPFGDDNGRLARTLFYWFALKNGYDVFQFLSISAAIAGSKGRYGDAYVMTETDDNDLTYFISYNLEAIISSIESMKEYLDRKFREESSHIMMMTDQGLTLKESCILESIKRNDREASIQEIASEFGISYETARKRMYRLEDSGFIRKTGVERKKQLYAAVEGFYII